MAKQQKKRRDEIVVRFAARLREVRLARGMTQADLASAAKVPTNMRVPVTSVIHRLFDADLLSDGDGQEDLSQWETQGRRLEGRAVVVEGRKVADRVIAIGNPKEGVLVEQKGKRVRVYDRPEFLEEVANKFPESIRWPNYGLPPARLVLLPGDLKAFTDLGNEVVSHGGISLEEVMVPFVTISREVV
jgi:transcriptional regulator with XRE-family HTH domain